MAAALEGKRVTVRTGCGFNWMPLDDFRRSDGTVSGIVRAQDGRRLYVTPDGPAPVGQSEILTSTDVVEEAGSR